MTLIVSILPQPFTYLIVFIQATIFCEEVKSYTTGVKEQSFNIKANRKCINYISSKLP